MAVKKVVQKKLIIPINANIYRELSIIATGAGFDSLESLVRNYLRDVALAARNEVSTFKIRQSIAKTSTDLDHLRPDTLDN